MAGVIPLQRGPGSSKSLSSLSDVGLGVLLYSWK